MDFDLKFTLYQGKIWLEYPKQYFCPNNSQYQLKKDAKYDVSSWLKMH